MKVIILLGVLCGFCAPAFATLPTGTIPSSYFGMNVASATTPWPSFNLSTIRTLGPSQSSWAMMNPSTGSYNFSYVDSFVQLSTTNHVNVIFVFVGTPNWASSMPSDSTCVNIVPNGGCDAPYDVAADGSGADMVFQTFVTALVNHIIAQNGSLAAWSFEAWNEPSGVGNGYWHGTQAQLARMTKDMYAIIKAASPSTLVLTPSVTTTNAATWLDGYFSALPEGTSNYVDVINFHDYPANAFNYQNYAITRVTSIQTVMHTYGLDNYPMWATEGSWGENGNQDGWWMNDDVSSMTAFVPRFIMLHWALGVSKFMWFGYGKTGSDTEFGTLWTAATGLLQPGISWAETYKWMNGNTMNVVCGTTTYNTTGSTSTWICGFSRPGGYTSLAVWNIQGPISFTPPSLGFIQYRRIDGSTYSYASGAVTVDATPILLETDNILPDSQYSGTNMFAGPSVRH